MRALPALFIGMMSSAGWPAEACQLTIPVLVNQLRPNPVELYRTRELVPIPFDVVAAKVDVVIEGIVQPLRTYLSDDQCDLYTEFEVVAPLVIFGTVPLATRPGRSPSIVVKQLGGTSTIDGVKVLVEDQQLPPFREGQRLVLLLSRLGSRDVFEIADGPFGAFVVRADDQVRPVLRTKGIYEEVQSLSRAQLAQRVQEAKEAKRR